MFSQRRDPALLRAPWFNVGTFDISSHVHIRCNFLQLTDLVASDSVDLSVTRSVAYDLAHFDASMSTHGVPYLTYAGCRQIRDMVLKTHVLTCERLPPWTSSCVPLRLGVIIRYTVI